MHSTILSSFADELLQISLEKKASALRSRLSHTRKSTEDGTIHNEFRLGNERVGLITQKADGSIDVVTPINEKFKGMGFGKKMYGEIARSQGSLGLYSDKTMTEEAARVWRGMGKRPGYQVTQGRGVRELTPSQANKDYGHYSEQYKPRHAADKLFGDNFVYHTKLPAAAWAKDAPKLTFGTRLKRLHLTHPNLHRAGGVAALGALGLGAYGVYKADKAIDKKLQNWASTSKSPLTKLIRKREI